MKGYWIFYFSFQIIWCQMLIGLFHSNLTDIELANNLSVSLLQTFADQIALKNVLITSCSDILHQDGDMQAIIDLTSSFSLAECINSFASQTQSIVISLENIENSYSDWRFFTHYSSKAHQNALSALVDFLNWNKFIVLSDELQKKNSYEFPNKTVSIFICADTKDQNLADLFVGKEIKKIGTRNIVILANGESAKWLLQSLKEKNIFNFGSGIVLGSNSFWGTDENGILAYVEEGLENSFDYISYESLSCISFIRLILNFSEGQNRVSLRDLLEKETFEHHPLPRFSLLNVQNNKRVKVGEIFHNEVTISSQIIFPGNSTLFPNAPITSIPISMADGDTNPGFPNSSYGSVIKWGANYALEYIVSSHFFDGFEFQVAHTDCGADVYNATFAFNCFSKVKDRLGIGFLTSYASTTCIGYINTLRKLNVSIPHVSEFAPHVQLTDEAAFPEFMRVYKEQRFNVGVLFSLLSVFNWKHINVYYISSLPNVAIYDYFEALVNKSNIKIENDRNERMLNANYRHSDFEKYKPWLQKALNSNVRIYILLFSPPWLFYFMQDLYDIGFRRNNFLLLHFAKVTFYTLTETDPTQIHKLNELFYNCIIIDQIDWVGEYGKQVKNVIEKQHSSRGDALVYRCFSFDSAMLLASGIKYTITQGKNIEDSSILNSNLRKQKFTGCSGTVSIAPGSNDRSTGLMGVFNFRWDEKQNSLDDYLVGKYDWGSTQLFSFYETIIWNDNMTTTYPSDMIMEGECPFDEKLIEYSTKGAAILYGFCFFVLIVAATATNFAWKSWKHIRINNLSVKAQAKFEDYLEHLIIFINFLQFLAMSPDIKEYDEYSSLLAGYIALNLDWMIERNKFWYFTYIILGAAGTWIYISFNILLAVDAKYSFFIFYFLGDFAQILVLILGNICFLPIVSFLISVVQCDQAIGNELSNSFVRWDCSVFCWKDSHLYIGALSISILIIYLPLAIFLKPYWNHSNDHINIRASPLYLISKAMLQVIIVILSKILKPFNQSLYGFIYIISFILFFLILRKKKFYNYHRCNLWTNISYSALIWSAIISSLYWIYPNKLAKLWFALQFLGWSSMVVAGIYMNCKYYPSLLDAGKQFDISLLVRFSFGKKVSAKEINKVRQEVLCETNFVPNDVESKENLAER
ncbi:unnamed protein product [Blepharisma stoltei]|uniref:Receptor ligand binding region domain-containing protein n=1 Tax=Blepharisma stoltei TaxID=1481888 RepID=A0AAU9KPV0_9CILI|nr:unnamed protein product [Blepharisma stoltei]